MDIRKVHILIEQGLQDVGVFAYADFEPEEVDLQIDKSAFSLIKSAFVPKQERNKFQFNQGVLDRLRAIHETGISLSGSTVDSINKRVIFDLPENYVHLVRDSSIVSLTESRCYPFKVCDKVKPGIRYKVLSGAVDYNGEIYEEGSTFIGVEGEEQFDLVSGKAVEVGQVKQVKSGNRLTESFELNEVLENSLTKTKADSPVSEISGSQLSVYFSNFIVDAVNISYIRKPSPVNINFQRYNQGSNLTTGVTYEVITAPVIHEGTTYVVGDRFVATGFSFSGSGIVRVADVGDLLFPEEVCYDIINDAVEALSIESEQSQQKIANLVSKNNVPS
jgi:hypothetical protein